MPLSHFISIRSTKDAVPVGILWCWLGRSTKLSRGKTSLLLVLWISHNTDAGDCFLLSFQQNLICITTHAWSVVGASRSFVLSDFL